jgi:hypothetical protein
VEAQHSEQIGRSPDQGHSPSVSYAASGGAKPRLTSGGKAALCALSEYAHSQNTRALRICALLEYAHSQNMRTLRICALSEYARSQNMRALRIEVLRPDTNRTKGVSQRKARRQEAKF